MTRHQLWVIAAVLCILKYTEVSAIKDTVGDYFQSTSTYPGNGRGVFLFKNAVVDSGVVYKFSTYVMRTSPVWLQIWRPSGDAQYTLVGQVRLNPQAVNEKYEVSLYPDKYIYTQAGDILGIFNEEESCPIAYRFNAATSAPLLYHTTEEGRTFSVGESLPMQEIDMPYQFSVTASYDTEVGPYTSPGPRSTESTTEPVPTIPNIPPTIGSMEYAGNGLRGKVSYIKQSARGMYLLPHIKLPKAVIVSFFAYFVRSEPICFQVLRLQSGEETYQLVGQVCHTPSTSPALEEVKLGPGQYIFTEQGDQLGYLNQEYTGSVGYTFLTNPYVQGPWSSGYDGTSVPQVWQSITFDQSWLPYDFAVGARYDTVIDRSKYGYPPTRPTSPPVTTTSSTTTKSGPTVPDITEKIIGIDYLQRADDYMASAARRTFLLLDLCFPSPGILTSFLFFPLRPGVIDLQVWRRHVNETTSMHYELVGHKRTNVNSFSEFQQVKLNENDEIQVQEGDCLGFSTMSDQGVIGYVFQKVLLSFAEEYADLEEGEILTFDGISLPYKFSLAATYKDLPPEPETTPTPPEPSAPSTTPKDSTTTTQPPRTGAVAGSEDGPAWLYDSRFLLALLIWLIVLTVLFLGLCCYISCCRGKQEQKAMKEAQRNSYLYGYHDVLRNNSMNSSRPNSKYGQMRANEVIDYFHPTIGSQPGIRRDDSMKKPLTREDSGASSFNGYTDSSTSVNNNNGRVVVTEADVREGPYTVL